MLMKKPNGGVSFVPFATGAAQLARQARPFCTQAVARATIIAPPFLRVNCVLFCSVVRSKTTTTTASEAARDRRRFLVSTFCIVLILPCQLRFFLFSVVRSTTTIITASGPARDRRRFLFTRIVLFLFFRVNDVSVSLSDVSSTKIKQ